jgi:phosphoserine aminotransferase
MPLPVLERVQRELVELPGQGMSVMEMSHRSARFEEINASAEARIRSLLGLGDEFHVLFLQGGASLQFSAVPLNCLLEGESADYVLTDEWSTKALKEASRVADDRGACARVAASTKEENFARVPGQGELELDPKARYVHITGNNTLFGTEFPYEPETGDVPLVTDASSHMLSRPMTVSKYGLIYAGAQKNLGPAGVTLVIVREDMLRALPASVPTMLDYKIHAKAKSLYNTPNSFGIWVLDMVCEWIQQQGGLTGIEAMNIDKAAVLYDAIDATDFYRGHAAKESRSRMNVTFRLPSEELEKKFVSEATAAGLDGLKGHRDVGGLRASIYNAFPREGVVALTEFMAEFERVNG